MDQITLLVCHKLNIHDKDGPIFIGNFNTEWSTTNDPIKITFTSEWHNIGKEADKTAALGLRIYKKEDLEDYNFHNKDDKSEILGILSSEDCCIEFTFYAKNRDDITVKKDVIDGEEVISITLNRLYYDCSINIEYKHRSMSGTLSEFDSTEIIPVSVAEKILHTNSIDEVLKIIKENKKYA